MKPRKLWVTGECEACLPSLLMFLILMISLHDDIFILPPLKGVKWPGPKDVLRDDVSRCGGSNPRSLERASD
jgi:hypothetical protein